MVNGAGVNLAYSLKSSSRHKRARICSSLQVNLSFSGMLSVSLQTHCFSNLSLVKFIEDHFRCLNFKGAERTMKSDNQHGTWNYNKVNSYNLFWIISWDIFRCNWRIKTFPCLYLKSTGADMHGGCTETHRCNHTHDSTMWLDLIISCKMVFGFDRLNFIFS